MPRLSVRLRAGVVGRPAQPIVRPVLRHRRRCQQRGDSDHHGCLRGVEPLSPRSLRSAILCAAAEGRPDAAPGARSRPGRVAAKLKASGARWLVPLVAGMHTME